MSANAVVKGDDLMAHILNLCTYNAPARQWFRLHECDRCARRRWSTHTSQGHLLFREKHREDVPRWLRRPGLLAGLEGPAVAEDAPLYPGATDVPVLSPA